MIFLDINDVDFEQQFASILSRGEEAGREVEQVVLDIIESVRRRGDDAVLEYTGRFDRLEAKTVAELLVTDEEIDYAFAKVKAEDIDALKLAVERVVSG